MSARPGSLKRVVVRSISNGDIRERPDVLATEEPLEIRLRAGGEQRTVAVTMRTPGSDFELACGFLYGEGVISGHGDVSAVSYCTEAEQQFNIVTVDLARRDLPELGSLERHFYTTSACGICGKASLDAIDALGGPQLGAGPKLGAHDLLALPGRLRDAQRIFTRTGGLHAAALFDASGEPIAVREDVGRHNAMDKLVGWGVLNDRLPFTDTVVLVSGRASFELVQKALRAGIAFFCAVSAPSSLAVDIAERFGMTLVGFLREESFNVYAGAERVAS